METLQFYVSFSPLDSPLVLKEKNRECSVKLPLPNFILVFSHGTWPKELKGKNIYCVIRLSKELKPFCIGSLCETQRSVCWQDYWRDDLYVKSVLMADEHLEGKLELTLQAPDDLSPVSVTPTKQETSRPSSTAPDSTTTPPITNPDVTPLMITSSTNEMEECILIDSSDSDCKQKSTVRLASVDGLAQTDAWLAKEKTITVKTYAKKLLAEVTPVVTSSAKRARRRKRNSKEIAEDESMWPSSQKKKTYSKLFNDEKNKQNVNTPKSAVKLCKTLATVTPTNGTNVPSCRWGHALCKINSDKMLLVGGQGQKQTLSRDSVWTLEKDGLNWTETPILVDTYKPQYRIGHTMTYDPTQECVYVYGGSKNMRWYNDVHVLDLKTWKWSMVKANGRAPTRAYHSSCLYRDELFVFGGVFPNRNPDPDGCSNKLLIYRPESEDWYEPIVIGKKPTPRSGHSSTVIRDQMIIFGGWDAPVSFNDVIILDLSLMEYSKPQTHGTAPSPRSWHASCRLPGDRVLIHGGFNGNQALNDAFVFSLGDHTWKKVELPIPKTDKAGHTLISCHEFGNKENISGKADVIMFGGGDNEGSFFNEVFTFQI